jgi:tetratricopeptide (TPR) repeat protein
MSFLRRLFGEASPRPATPVDFLAEALALESAGDVSAAINSYKLAVRDRPNDTKALQNFAILLSKTGQPDEAIRHYRRALEVNPSLAGAHYGIGFLLLKRGDTRGAIRHLESFVAASQASGDSAKWVHHAQMTLDQLRVRDAAMSADAASLESASLEP